MLTWVVHEGACSQPHGLAGCMTVTNSVRVDTVNKNDDCDTGASMSPMIHMLH